ncbi:hypothetical protein K450DRAFT_239847 [Umbelopsis ramanniana AG]|uniref:RRM domain-containing protein n=1 Tax=Umbelopsis ramanniana AG TaxID=1314678 RepID=A0AAD5HD57_UMBRA|nr:uncharacterized protein K450DRAFT_239847 [Umbelopsis ramanniana AG]KAI8579945.1 hypothetical protein K450DRAFT_239847 [Umbelopsis ramanniana AG]
MAEPATDPVIDTPVPTSEATGSEEVKFKQVFVGNLPFKTTEEDLIQFFQVAGKVEKASIVTRGRRSLGYGFVSFETPEEAEKAAQDLDKKEFGARQVNVEIAKPQSNSVNGTPKPRSQAPPKRRQRRDNKEASTSDAEQRADDGSAEGIETAENGTAAERATKPKNSKKRVPRKTTKAPARIDGATTNRGEPSKTTLFVGNLPFSTDDEGLKDILQNYRVKSAHVVKRKTGRSKGYGFVEMEDEAEQQKVLDEMKTVTVDGREVSIKVSVSVPHSEEYSTEDATAEATTDAE